MASATVFTGLEHLNEAYKRLPDSALLAQRMGPCMNRHPHEREDVQWPLSAFLSLDC